MFPFFLYLMLTITQMKKIVNRAKIHTENVYKYVDNVDNVDNKFKIKGISHLHRVYKCGKGQKKSTDLVINNCVQTCG